MGDIIFFVKSLVFTFIVIVLLQIKVGETTLEEKSASLVKNSSAGLYLSEVAQGGLKVLSDMYGSVLGKIDKKVGRHFNSEKLPGRRKILGALERSQTYVKEEYEKKEREEQLLREYEEAAKSIDQ